MYVYIYIIYCFLCFIYLFIFMFYLFMHLYCFIFYFFSFYTEQISVERCFNIYFSLCESIYLFTYLFGGTMGEFIFGRAGCWWHAILSTMKYSVPLQEWFVRGSVFPVKTMAHLCFCLRWTSPWTLDTFLAVFITHLCCSSSICFLINCIYSYLFGSKFIVWRSFCSHSTLVWFVD